LGFCVPRVLTTSDVADFRERLCEAAARLFAERGREGFTMRELAAEMGVSAMTPYRYFADKDEILAAVRARAFNAFAEALETAFAGEGPPSLRSARVGDAYIRFAFGQPASYRLMFDLSQPNEENYSELVAASTRARATMTDHVRALVESGVLEGDPDLIAHVCWAALHGAVVLQLAGKLKPEYDFERIAGEIFRALRETYSPHN
jgi:AcrR family transcriptional regulator